MELKGKYCKDCTIFTDNIDQESLSLVYGLLDHPVFEGQKIRIMPDVHMGKGMVVGFTVPITSSINPSHVSADIGCMMTSLFFEGAVKKEDVVDIEHKVREAIPMGFEINKKKVFEDKEFFKYMNGMMRAARSMWPEVVENVQVSEKYITEMMKRIGMNEGVFYRSLCSVGGGNHFLEMGELDGHAVWTIHCGSRHLGQKVCKYWEKRASGAGDAPNGYLTGEDMIGYMTDLFFAQGYASWNHELICRALFKIMQKKGYGKMTNKISTIHNYVSPLDHVLRKGAIRAGEGDTVILPFNMRDGIAICKGKGNPEWNFSAPHGCGRLMSRAKAKAEIDPEEVKESMKNVYTTGIPIDESPQAYKPMEEILGLIEDTLEVKALIKPVINIKANEETKA